MANLVIISFHKDIVPRFVFTNFGYILDQYPNETTSFHKSANFQVDYMMVTKIIIIFTICHGKSNLGKSDLGKSTLGKKYPWERLHWEKAPLGIVRFEKNPPWETHPWNRCNLEQSLGKRLLGKINSKSTARTN